MRSEFFKWQFSSLCCRHKGPPSLFLIIKSSEKRHISVKMAELCQRNRAPSAIYHSCVELAHHIEQARRGYIEVPPAHVSRVRKQSGLGETGPRTIHSQSEIVPGKKRMSSHSGDRQSHLDRGQIHRGCHRHVTIAGENREKQRQKARRPVRPFHLACTFGAAPIASSPACAQASSRCAPGAPPTPIPPSTSPPISIGNPPPSIKMSLFISRRA